MKKYKRGQEQGRDAETAASTRRRGERREREPRNLRSHGRENGGAKDVRERE